MRNLTEQEAKQIGQKLVAFNRLAYLEINSSNDPEVVLGIKKIVAWTEQNQQVEVKNISSSDGMGGYRFFDANGRRIFTACLYPSPLETVKVTDKYGEVEVDYPVAYLN